VVLTDVHHNKPELAIRYALVLVNWARTLIAVMMCPPMVTDAMYKVSFSADMSCDVHTI
jgi:hypothetical protein